ncbi:MAG TPA: MoaD/ThiS family protein [Gemmataceae bacterium]|jgi:molybdopterin converting factor small subunit|nr:MoaD/ThiS family protein [Gemmataceae bacterium]
MRVTVEFFGPARDAAGTARVTVDRDSPCSAQDLVVQLARERGGRLANLLLHDERLAPSILLAVNDRQVTESMLLNDGDEVTVIPPVSGGAA